MRMRLIGGLFVSRLFGRPVTSNRPKTGAAAHHHKPAFRFKGLRWKGAPGKAADEPVVLSVTEIFCVPPPPEKVKLAGDALQDAPAGKPLQENDTDPVNPCAAERSTVAMALPPCRTETWFELGAALRLKSVTPVPVSWTMWLPFKAASVSTNCPLRAPAAVGLNVTAKEKCGINTGALGGPPGCSRNGVVMTGVALKSPVKEACCKIAGADP